MIKEICNVIRIQDKLKNILIFLPIFFDTSINSYKLIDLFFGFILFFFLTNIIYIINDFTDIQIDKINKLKKHKINKKLSIIILIISLLPIILLFFFKKEIFNIYFYLYLIVFLFYNYFFKKKKYLDVIFLSFFYLIRIYYGFEIYEKLEISLGFTVFFFLLFIHLAFVKKYLQIFANDFQTNNKIITYNFNDTSKIKNLTYILSASNLFFILLYIFHNTVKKIPNLFLLENQNEVFEIFLFMIFFIFFIFKTNKILSDKPKKEIISVYLLDYKFLSLFSILIFIFLFF